MNIPNLPGEHNKQILVLSDLHIGRKYANWKLALKLMSHYNWKRIIIAGDAFDIWYRPMAIFAMLMSTIFSKIGKKIVYVVGNHDEEIYEVLLNNEPFMLVTNRYQLTINDKHFTFIHGHEVDKFNNQVSWIGAFLTKLQAIFHKIFKVDTHRFTSGFIHRLMEKKQRNKLIEKYSTRTDVLVYGHTHKPLEEKVPVGNRTFEIYNTGDWVRNNTFLVIEDDGNVLRHKIEK